MPPSSSATVTKAPKSAAGHDDFFWTYTEEPHRTRRLAIIKAHPEVTRSLSSFSLDLTG